MELQLIDTSLDCDQKMFCDIVFDFIERIVREASVYEDNSCSFDANDFRHIEYQIQAKRIEKVLQLCISKIHQVFILSHLIVNQRDHLKLLFDRKDAQQIEKFAENCFDAAPDPTNHEFETQLNRCLDATERTNKEFKMRPVTINNILLLLISFS